MNYLGIQHSGFQENLGSIHASRGMNMILTILKWILFLSEKMNIVSGKVIHAAIRNIGAIEGHERFENER